MEIIHSEEAEKGQAISHVSSGSPAMGPSPQQSCNPEPTSKESPLLGSPPNAPPNSEPSFAMPSVPKPLSSRPPALRQVIDEPELQSPKELESGYTSLSALSDNDIDMAEGDRNDTDAYHEKVTTVLENGQGGARGNFHKENNEREEKAEASKSVNEEEEEDDGEDEDEDEDDEDDEDEDSDDVSEKSVSDMDSVNQDNGLAEDHPAQSDNQIGNPDAKSVQDDYTGEAQQNPDASSNQTKKDHQKKKVKRRSPSVDVTLPVGPPPRPTVRLKLTTAKNEEEQYLVNIPEEMYEALKESNGPWAEWYGSTVQVSDGEIESEEATDGRAGTSLDTSELGDLAKLLEKYPTNMPSSSKKSKKKGLDVYDIGQYDVKDPFVDDSELGVDEPTHQAKPSADGFFVTQGEVELEKLERGKSALEGRESSFIGNKRSQIPPAFGEETDGAGGAGSLFLKYGPSTENIRVVNTMISQRAHELGIPKPETTHDSQQKLSNGNAAPSHVSDPAATSSASLNAKYAVDPVPPRLERAFDELRRKVSQESWLKKSKFPPSLREPLINTSLVAIELDEYDMNFFNWLPHIFPYNRLTLHKYTKRQIFEKHVALARKIQDLNFAGFERQVKEQFPSLKSEYEERLAEWLAKGGREQSPERDVGGTEKLGEETTNTAGIELEGEDADGDGDGITSKPNDGSKPVKRWQWTESLREILFTIMTIDNAINELKTEKATLESSTEKASTLNSRKIIYKRMIDLWPEKGWMTTTALSNQYGLYKRKVDKYAAMLHEGQLLDDNMTL